jgi:hypothetical protein
MGSIRLTKWLAIGGCAVFIGLLILGAAAPRLFTPWSAFRGTNGITIVTNVSTEKVIVDGAIAEAVAVANDTTTSNGVLAAARSSDIVTSNGVLAAAQASDITTSNGLNGKFILNNNGTGTNPVFFGGAVTSSVVIVQSDNGAFAALKVMQGSNVTGSAIAIVDYLNATRYRVDSNGVVSIMVTNTSVVGQRIYGVPGGSNLFEGIGTNGSMSIGPNGGITVGSLIPSGGSNLFVLGSVAAGTNASAGAKLNVGGTANFSGAITNGADIIPATDNTSSLGASARRFGTVYGSAATMDGNGLNLTSVGLVYWTGRSTLKSPKDKYFSLSDSADRDFGGVFLGGSSPTNGLLRFTSSSIGNSNGVIELRSGNTNTWLSFGSENIGTHMTNWTADATSFPGTTNTSTYNQIWNVRGTSGNIVFWNRTGLAGATAAGIAIWTNTIIASGSDIVIGVNCGIAIDTGVSVTGGGRAF